MEETEYWYIDEYPIWATDRNRLDWLFVDCNIRRWVFAPCGYRLSYRCN